MCLIFNEYLNRWKLQLHIPLCCTKLLYSIQRNPVQNLVQNKEVQKIRNIRLQDLKSFNSLRFLIRVLFKVQSKLR